MSFYSIVLVLFLIMDPLGNISSFLSQLQGYDGAKKRLVVLREMGFALGAMLLFFCIGEFLFQFLDVSEITVMLSSGIILFLVAIQILFPTVSSLRENLPKEKPFVIPLAIPLTAGPSLLATIMLYAHTEPSVMMLQAILFAWALATAILLLAPEIFRFVGKNGLLAAEKLMGMVLIMLGIQRIMEGIHLFIQNS